MKNPLDKLPLFLLLLLPFCSKAQDSLKVAKSNPIVFFEGYVGFAGAKTAGWTAGATLNYQFFRTDLLTARLGAFIGYDTYEEFEVVGIPFYQRQERLIDYGLLYGKRWIRGGTSFSISAGVSYTHHKYLEKIDQDYFFRKDKAIGMPFELNVKFFKKQKRRYRAYYGLIPVTKQKVAFGRSFGFKFVGNWSKTSYAGFGISFGLGTHKKY